MSLPNPGNIALHAVQAAASFIGVHEIHNSNTGPEVDRFLADVGVDPGAPWCAAFVHYCLDLAAKAEGKAIPKDFPRSGYCPDFAQWGVKRGLFIHTGSAKGLIQRGDQVLFYFSSMGRVAHTGIVAHVDGDQIITLEGNTSNAAGVNRDGGEVARKVRSLSELGTYGGFLRLPF